MWSYVMVRTTGNPLWCTASIRCSSSCRRATEQRDEPATHA